MIFQRYFDSIELVDETKYTDNRIRKLSIYIPRLIKNQITTPPSNILN